MKKRQLKKLVPIVVSILFLLVCAAWFFFYSGSPRQKATVPTVKVYFFKGERLYAVERGLKPEDAPLRKALLSLLAGPTKEELQSGVRSQLPKGVKLRNVKTNGKIAIVDFSGKLEAYGGGSSRVEGLVAQIVYTATGIPGVEKVWIWEEGQKEVVLGGEGLVLDKPLGRKDLSN